MQNKDTILSRNVDALKKDEEPLEFDFSTPKRTQAPIDEDDDNYQMAEGFRFVVDDETSGLNSAYNPASHAISENTRKDFVLLNEQTHQYGLTTSIGNQAVTITTNDNLAEADRYLGVNTDKMLIMLMSALCTANSYVDWQKDPQISNLTRTITFNYENFANVTGVDISSARAKSRASASFKNQLKQLKHIDIDNANYKDGDYSSFGIVNHFDVRASKNYIKAELDAPFVVYMMCQPRTIVDPKLLLIPAKNNTYVYNVGKVLNERFYMTNNRKKKTHDRIQICNLLKSAGFPNQKQIDNKYSRNWKRATVDPLERALEELKKEPHDMLEWTAYGPANCEIVKNKDYPKDGNASKYILVSKKDNKQISDCDYDAMNIYKDFYTYSSMYLYYKFNDDYSID